MTTKEMEMETAEAEAWPTTGITSAGLWVRGHDGPWVPSIHDRATVGGLGRYAAAVVVRNAADARRAMGLTL